MSMEIYEYLPGALAALIMTVRIAMFFRDRKKAERDAA